MDVEQRLALVLRNTEETVTEEELRALLMEKEEPTAYIGFEPSGLVHLGWVLVAQKIRDLCDAGFKVTIFWADWHAYINDKLGGDLENIRTCARYMQDCFIALGVLPTVWSSSTPVTSSATSITGRWSSKWRRSPPCPGSRGP